MLIAAGCGPARVPTCEQALWYGRSQFYHLIAVGNERWFLTDKLRHDLRFDKWHDDYDATTLALRKLNLRTVRVDDYSPVLLRALSLFGPSELRALRVRDIDVFCLVTSLMQKAPVSGDGPAPQIAQATDALCALHFGDLFSQSREIDSLAAVLKRHSPTITELDGELSATMSKAAVDEVSSALACCTRLESLTGAYAYDPALWLGLSQLHTLRGVDLRKVSPAAIAAALPKLHTLKVFGYCNDPTEATLFCTDLLPRLRVFHFEGTWPDVQERPATPVAPLPLLEELVWDVSQYESAAPRELLGAQPTVLHAPYDLISQCWIGGADASADLLARVCELRLMPPYDADPLDPTDVARLLRAAPQLGKFHVAHCVQGDASWLAPTAFTQPFEELIHPRLREFGITFDEDGDSDPEATPPDAEWVTHLRRRHFPRLRELAVGDSACFVTPPDNLLVATSDPV
jgi:hypothetical protein